MPLAVKRKNHYAPRSTPVGEMNLTPFIDVLLVLLIMMILAMPMKIHVTDVDLPNGEPIVNLPILEQNTVSIDPSDQLFWNGEAVSPKELRNQVAATTVQPEQPLLRFAPDAQASYDSSARTIALIKQGGVRKFAFIGNEQHRTFGS